MSKLRGKVNREEIRRITEENRKSELEPIINELSDNLIFDIASERIIITGVGFKSLINVESIVKLYNFLKIKNKYTIFIGVEYGKPVIYLIE